jgi:uncharacterized 2Fe-2S/4Fe-4S cluster protein (DUF4445 family)
MTIERVWVTPREIQYQTIDHEKPIGICGSGILEALAQLRQAGVIDIAGGLLPGTPMIRKGEKGLEVLVSPAGQNGNGRDIVITRKDISEIQMAKGAIRISGHGYDVFGYSKVANFKIWKLSTPKEYYFKNILIR